MAGDPDAFGVVFSRHRDRMWAVAIRTLGDGEEAADALQDAMISAFRQAGSFRGDSAVTTWLHRIVVNACLDRLRRKAARPAASGLDDDALDALALRPSARDAGHDSDIALDVAAALRLLPPDQRAALVLVDMLGYSVADAASALNTTVGTVKSRCARGRAKLLPHLAHLRVPGAAGLSEAATGAQEGMTQAGPSSRTAVPPGPGAMTQTGRNQSPAGRVSPGRGGGERKP